MSSEFDVLFNHYFFFFFQKLFQISKNTTFYRPTPPFFTLLKKSLQISLFYLIMNSDVFFVGIKLLGIYMFEVAIPSYGRATMCKEMTLLKDLSFFSP